MKFLVSCTNKAKIKQMLKDLDKQIEEAEKQKKSLKYRMANKVYNVAFKIPMMFNLSYKVISQKSYELSVFSSAEPMLKKGIMEKMVKERTRDYGRDVKITVI